LSLALLVTTQFKVLASLQRNLFAVFTFSAFHPQHDFLGGFGLQTTSINTKLTYKVGKWGHLLPEDGLSLSTKTLLFSVVTSPALGRMTLLGFLILGHLV
jgi:hypothetical protein